MLVKPPVIPKKLNAWLTINRSCNLRCDWCYAKMTGFTMQNMSMATVRSSLDLFQSLNMEAVILLGGEPTVHPQFIRIVNEIRARGLKAYVVTNGIKFAEKAYVDEIVSAGVSAVTISLKAFDPDGYLASTGKDAFAKVRAGIENIVQSRIQHVVNVTLCEDTMQKIDSFIALMQELGVHGCSLDTGKPIILDDKTYADGMGKPKDLAKFFMDAYPKLVKSGLRFSLKIAVPFCLFPKEFVDRIIADDNLLTGCQMVTRKGIIVDPKGHIIPCNHLCNMSLGHIGDIKTREQFVGFRSGEAVSQFYERVSTCPSDKCVDCARWQQCGAGCKLYWLHYGEKEMMGYN